MYSQCSRCRRSDRNRSWLIWLPEVDTIWNKWLESALWVPRFRFFQLEYLSISGSCWYGISVIEKHALALDYFTLLYISFFCISLGLFEPGLVLVTLWPSRSRRFVHCSWSQGVGWMVLSPYEWDWRNESSWARIIYYIILLSRGFSQATSLARCSTSVSNRSHPTPSRETDDWSYPAWWSTSLTLSPLFTLLVIFLEWSLFIIIFYFWLIPAKKLMYQGIRDFNHQPIYLWLS